MNPKKIFKSVFNVSLSNFLSLAVGVLVGVILPIIFTIEDYGYYRLYTLYLGYLGFFHFGFLDGIFLHFGGYELGDLDNFTFKAFAKFLLIFEFIFSIIMLIYAIFVLNGDRQFVFICLSLSLISINFNTYFQFVSQITFNFKLYAKRNVIYSICLISIISVLFAFKISNFKVLLALLVLVNLIIILWYSFKYRSITFGKNIRLLEHFDIIKKMFMIGFPLLIANLITVFILNFSKQLVDVVYGIEKFAIFSFSYSLMNFVNIFVQSVSTVLYPSIKNTDKDKLKNNYNYVVYIVLFITSIGITAYYPLDFMVQNYITKYVDAVKILAIIFPGLIITSTIQIVKLNYFKSLNIIKPYFITGFFTLGISVFSGITAWYFFDSLEAIAISTIVSFLIWHIITEIYFKSRYKITIYKNMTFVVFVFSLYYISLLFTNPFIGLIVYSVSLAVISFTIFSKETKKLISMVLKEKK